jgi:ABC-type branched-subunit amino acid transport system substrate-binding protein
MESNMETKRLSRDIAVLAAASAAVLGLLTACSSSSKTPTTSAKGKTSGAPVKLMWIGALTGPANHAGDVLAGAKAAVKAINASGGVKGRPLSLIACDDAFDANKGAACARQAKTEGVVAIVGEDTSTGDSTMPALDAAGIPSIGISASSPSENKSAFAFPLGSGSAGEVFGEALMFEKLGCQHPGLAYGDFAAAKFVADAWVTPVLTKGGLKVAKNVAIPASASDLTSYASSLTSNGVDCVAYIDNPDKTALLVKALRASNSKVKIIMPNTNWGPSRIKSLGGDANGLYIASGFASPDQSNAKVKQYNTEMDALGGGTDRNELSQNAWNATHITAALLTGLPTISAATLTAAVKAAGSQDFSGAVPTYNWSAAVALLPGTRTFGSSVFFSVIKDGVLTPLLGGKSFDLLKPASVPAITN